MNKYSYQNLNKNMHPGQVYRRDMLAPYSKAVDRDLHVLVSKGELKKLAGGLYYKPRSSVFGALPPKDENLVSCFLRDKHYLLYSWNQYNSLGLGLTQLYNRVVVLNKKRHGVFKLGNKEYDFRRPNNGFPGKLTREFILVDLLNNFKELQEDTTNLKDKVKKNIDKFDKTKLLRLAREYGKVGTKHFFEQLIS